MCWLANDSHWVGMSSPYAAGYEPRILKNSACSRICASTAATTDVSRWPSKSTNMTYSHRWRLVGRDSIFVRFSRSAANGSRTRTSARGEPGPALREGLRMRADGLDLVEVGRAGQQVLRHLEADLAAEEHVGVDQPVEGETDRALGRVLYRDDAVLGAVPLDVLEHVE